MHIVYPFYVNIFLNRACLNPPNNGGWMPCTEYKVQAPTEYQHMCAIENCTSLFRWNIGELSMYVCETTKKTPIFLQKGYVGNFRFFQIFAHTQLIDSYLQKMSLHAMRICSGYLCVYCFLLSGKRFAIIHVSLKKINHYMRWAVGLEQNTDMSIVGGWCFFRFMVKMDCRACSS